MKMYYLVYTDCNGENMDLFVSAHTAEGAFRLWSEYYDDSNKSGGDQDNGVRITSVPTLGPLPMAHNWASMPFVTIFDALTGEPL